MKAGRTVGALFARIVEHVMDRVRFLGTYAYVVQSQANEQLDLRPRSKRAGLPDSIRAPMRCGVPGAKGEPAPGSIALVRFLDGDRAQPYIEGFASVVDGLFVPSTVTIDASGSVAIAPSGDAKLSATAGVTAYLVRNGEKVGLSSVPPFADGDSFAAAALAGTLILTLASAELLVPGPPGIGHSRATA